jgi:hypothetical protein
MGTQARGGWQGLLAEAEAYIKMALDPEAAAWLLCGAALNTALWLLPAIIRPTCCQGERGLSGDGVGIAGKDLEPAKLGCASAVGDSQNPA